MSSLSAFLNGCSEREAVAWDALVGLGYAERDAKAAILKLRDCAARRDARRLKRQKRRQRAKLESARADTRGVMDVIMELDRARKESRGIRLTPAEINREWEG